MKYKAYADRIIVEKLEEPEKIGSIYLPENATRSGILRGRVVDITGEGTIKVGDVILFNLGGTPSIGNTYFVKTDNILAIEASE